jgi:hypothetical protein
VNRYTFLISFVLFFTQVKAQSEFIQGELGFTVGGAHYFGDLNTRTGLNAPKPALGLLFRRPIGNYIGLRLAAKYLQVGYSDAFSKNEYQHMRNLSFNSDVFEFMIQGDFNFFKFIPNSENNRFTPYVTIGAGVFNFNPYTYYNGTKYFLRPLGTEGQVGGYLGRTEYSTLAMCVPFGVGIKLSLNKNVNMTFEVSQRFTSTDYLDDVSTTFAPNPRNSSGAINYFPYTSNNKPSIADLLQDRSYEIDPLNTLSSVPGRQRGWSKQKDQYGIAEIGITFNLNAYRCPN